MDPYLGKDKILSTHGSLLDLYQRFKAKSMVEFLVSFNVNIIKKSKAEEKIKLYLNNKL